jgi:phage shock protein C
VNPRRLYRCRHDRQLAGVASGMAEYLDIDPTVVRILWILSVFLGGLTILLYIILAFVIPLEPATSQAPAWWRPAGEGASPESGPAGSTWQAPGPHQRPDDRRGGRAGLFFGVLLIVFGAIAMANVLIPGWAISGLLWPGFIVALGAALLVASIRRTSPEPTPEP